MALASRDHVVLRECMFGTKCAFFELFDITSIEPYLKCGSH